MIMKVVMQGETSLVDSQKSENGKTRQVQHRVAGVWRKV